MDGCNLPISAHSYDTIFVISLFCLFSHLLSCGTACRASHLCRYMSAGQPTNSGLLQIKGETLIS